MPRTRILLSPTEPELARIDAARGRVPRATWVLDLVLRDLHLAEARAAGEPLWSAAPRTKLLTCICEADVLINDLAVALEAGRGMDDALGTRLDAWIGLSRGPIAEACGEPVEPAVGLPGGGQ